MGEHLTWRILTGKISRGSECLVENLAEEVRSLDLKENLNRGNHKSRNSKRIGSHSPRRFSSKNIKFRTRSDGTSKEPWY